MRVYAASAHGGRLPLGKQGENKAEKIIFPFSEFSMMEAALLHQRATDTQPYPVTASWTDDGLEWVITNTDTDVVGNGQLEIQFRDDDGTVVKTVTYGTSVSTALTEPTEEAPDPYADWYSNVLAASASAQTSKNAAAASATASANSATAAAASAVGVVTAEAARVTAENARVAAENARVSTETARGTAETARVAAENARVVNETGRNSAEAGREAYIAQLKADVAAGEFDGRDGVDGTSVSHSWNGTVLNVTSASGTSAADLQGPQGPKGDTGAQGRQGVAGTGVSHAWYGTTLRIVSASGASSMDLKGQKGDPGKDGDDYVITDSDYEEIADVAAETLQESFDDKYDKIVATQDTQPTDDENRVWIRATGGTTTKLVEESDIAPIQQTIADHNTDITNLQTGKQDVISDLETIRAGAASGATAERKLADGWTLKGTITGDSNDRGNIDTGCTVDLTGCSELFVYAKAYGTGGTGLATNFGTILDPISAANNYRTSYARYVDSPLGIECVNSRYRGSTTSYQNLPYAVSNGYCYFDGKHISNISQFKFGNKDIITNCDIKIYAR